MPDRFECAVASAARDEPLTATASQVRAWLLVEVRGAWGRDAIVDSALGAHVEPAWSAALRARGVRIIAIRRDREPRRAPGLTLIHAVAGRPGTQPAQAWTRQVDGLDHVIDATSTLGEGPMPAGWTEASGPIVLVCTNGRHDSCCATYGRPLIRHLHSSTWAESVWECSHVGGDRFAGNLVLLPDSLYFGRCGPEDADRVLAAFESGRLDLTRFRGRSTFRLAEQAAEHFVREQRGLDRLDAVAAIAPHADGTYRVAVDEDGRRVELEVEIERRRVPSPDRLTCKGREGLEVPEFHLVRLTECSG